MVQYSVDVRNAKLDAIESAIGTSPVMEIRSGPKPESCSSPDEGQLLATFMLPVDWLLPAEDGVKTLARAWRTNAEKTGVPGYFRVYSSDGPCKLQGAVGTDMQLDRMGLTAGQIFTVLAFTIRDNNG